MASLTESGLSTERLRQLANEPAQTLAQLTSVLLSLTSEDEECRNWACEALENSGIPRVADVESLAGLVGHRNSLVASWACKLLARLTVSAMPAEPQLVEVLGSGVAPLVQEEAARALGLLGEISSAARVALERVAQTGGPRLKRIATAALGG